MIDIVMIGLILDALGALIVLLPGLPFVMEKLDCYWRFNELESGKSKLWDERELAPGDPGFERISSIIHRREDIQSQVEEMIQNDLERHPSARDNWREWLMTEFPKRRLEMFEENGRFDYTIEYEVKTFYNTRIIQYESRRFFDILRVYKERLVISIGAICLALGFIIQIIGRILT
jgi:hypothetical protein